MKHTLTSQSLNRYLALFISLTAILMVSNAAWDRGGNLFDRVLLVAMSISFCLGAHLIPAISKGALSWLLWAGCLFGTVYSQLVFITYSNMRAGEIEENVPLGLSSYQTAATLRNIRWRPVTK